MWQSEKIQRERDASFARFDANVSKFFSVITIAAFAVAALWFIGSLQP
ncbi:hypothetical protein [Aminobacter sp. BE322]